MIKREFFKSDFTVNEVLEQWEKTDRTKDLIVLESVHSDWSIEVDGFQSISPQVFTNFLSKVNAFDHEVQLYCKEVYEKSNNSIENYLVTLQWISVLEDSVTMGYWGDYVNIELRSHLRYQNGIWKQISIFYQ